jgi:hypothetical protein
VKPLALFGVIVGVGLVAIAAALHFTNHTASATPPLRPLSAQERFVRAGNGLCARAYNEVMDTFEARGVPKTVKMKAKYLRLQLALEERLDPGFRALEPPARDAGAYRQLLRIDRRGIHDTRAELHAYATGQLWRVTLLDRAARRDHVGRRYNALARKIGLTICGLNAHQVMARYG